MKLYQPEHMKLKTTYFFSEFTILDLSKVHFEEN